MAKRARRSSGLAAGTSGAKFRMSVVMTSSPRKPATCVDEHREGWCDTWPRTSGRAWRRCEWACVDRRPRREMGRQDGSSGRSDPPEARRPRPRGRAPGVALVERDTRDPALSALNRPLSSPTVPLFHVTVLRKSLPVMRPSPCPRTAPPLWLAVPWNTPRLPRSAGKDARCPLLWMASQLRGRRLVRPRAGTPHPGPSRRGRAPTAPASSRREPTLCVTRRSGVTTRSAYGPSGRG
jgi:hypothetical protein